MVCFAVGSTYAQTRVSTKDFGQKNAEYNNKEIILDNAEVIQNYATTNPDGSINNPFTIIKADGTKRPTKSIPEPNCKYRKGYTEIRLSGLKYCMMMPDELNKKYTEEIAKINFRSYKFGVRADFTLKGNAQSGYIITDYKWRQ